MVVFGFPTVFGRTHRILAALTLLFLSGFLIEYINFFSGYPKFLTIESFERGWGNLFQCTTSSIGFQI